MLTGSTRLRGRLAGGERRAEPEQIGIRALRPHEERVLEVATGVELVDERIGRRRWNRANGRTSAQPIDADAIGRPGRSSVTARRRTRPPREQR